MKKFLKFAYVLLVSAFCLNAKAQDLKTGLKYLEAEQYTKAQSIFEANAKTAPNAENYFYLGYFYLQTDQPEKAKEAFDKGAAGEAKDANVNLNFVGLGAVALYKGSKAEAQTQFAKAMANTKNKNANVLYRVGEAYTYFPLATDFEEAKRKRDYAEAIRVLTLASKIDTKNPEILTALGDAHMIPNDGSNAYASYDAAIRLDDKSAKTYIKSANLLIRNRNYSGPDGALAVYTKGLTADPNYAPGYRKRAELLFRAGFYKEAIADLKKYIELSENKNDAKLLVVKSLFLSGQELQKERKAAEAVEAYKELLVYAQELENIPTIDPVIYRLMGYAYFESKDPKAKTPIAECGTGVQKMETFFKKYDAKRIVTSDYAYYGKLLACNGQDSLALIELEKASNADTADHEILGVIAGIHNSQAAAASKAATAARKNKDEKTAVAQTNLARDKYAKAAHHYEKVIVRKKEKATANDYFTLGRTYYFGKSFEKADTAFGTMISKSMTNPGGLVYGYLWRARTKSYIDNEKSPDKTPESLGWLALPYYEKFNTTLREEDKVKFKSDRAEDYNYIGNYYRYKKNDPAKAKENWQKALEVEPENKEAKESLNGLNPNAPKTGQKSGK
ncbi:MAG: hypothetical protein H7Y04_11115 [Verrucomicrobia bacterium]|nr:hypothetical protein [Cytophagales bacterium]